MRLLSDSDPAPFRVIEATPSSPFVLSADHAGRAIPSALGDLGLPASELERHIAWDIGIAPVSERLARELGAFLILQNYSRLVIDCNRPLDSSTSIVQLSESTVIPGNASLSAEEVEARAKEIFEPYHRALERELERRTSVGQPTIFVAMHSFTPRYKGVDRPWDCGVLYHRDTRLAHRMLRVLRNEGLQVGDNEPYSVSDHTDYGVPHYGEKRGNLHVELEIRQDLIGTSEQQASWGVLVARALREATSE